MCFERISELRERSFLMRKVSSILALVVGGLSIAGLQSHADAAIGIYYAETSVDAMWGYDRDPDESVASPALSYTKKYGSTSGGAYLSGSWDFNKTSSIIASAGVPDFRLGADGMANGLGTMASSLSSDGFSINGEGHGDVQYDTDPMFGTDATTLYSNGTATYKINFDVPADGGDYTLKMTTATASADPYTMIMVRLAGRDALGNVTTLIDFERMFGTGDTIPGDTFETASWTGQEFILKAGSVYALDAYANADWPYADAIDSGPFSATAQFNLVGTFVPEPSALVLLLGGAGLALRRRRGRSA